MHMKQGHLQFHPQYGNTHTRTNQQMNYPYDVQKLWEKVKALFTIAPGYRDALKEYKEQETHSTGRVVVKKLKHIDSTLKHKKEVLK